MSDRGGWSLAERLTGEEVSHYVDVHHRKVNAFMDVLLSEEERRSDFWDVIVVTAADEEQRNYYQQQLQLRKIRKSIPLCCDYHVVADPTGPKIGCGGSTLFVLDFLELKYGSHCMDTCKVLLIHAGGYSTRLPNHSATGKIFATVPLAHHQAQAEACTMLELKLILLIDFPKRMNAGVFISCADDIELFDSERSSFQREGFTSMAHPASPEIGLNHGVFVLEEVSPEQAGEGDGSFQCGCSRFLHKPSIEEMENAGAIITGSKNKQPHIFVDSNFFFDREMAKTLLRFYKENEPITCEIDAYGDFLQPLGPMANDEYLQKARNVVTITSTLHSLRSALFHLLKDKPLNVIPFVPSLFMHIGTCSEYLEHYCNDLPLLGFGRFVCNSHDLTTSPFSSSISPKCCILNSILSPELNSVVVASHSVIEFCRLKNVRVGHYCILSDIEIKGTDVESPIRIPDGLFLHTLPIRISPSSSQEQHSSSTTYFVTAIFAAKGEHFKLATPLPEQLSWCGVHLTSSALQRIGRNVEQVWPQSNSNNISYSLWNARLFEAAPTAKMSLQLSLKMLRRLRSEEEPEKDEQAEEDDKMLFSWEEALARKDMAAQLERRERHIRMLQPTKEGTAS